MTARFAATAWLACAALALCLPGEASSASLALDATPAGIQRYFAEHDYVDAEEACRQLIKARPGYPDACYDLACALAREGKAQQAIDALKDAVQDGFWHYDTALSDDDLASLRKEPGFDAVIAAMRALTSDAGAPCEIREDVPHARLVDRTPAGGMHERLYLPEAASAQKPARLMLWLHPSGASLDVRVLRGLAPDLLAHGWALMIFPEKQYHTWTQEEYVKLEPCIRDARADPAIAQRRPVALTFSAGGQLALEIWRMEPRYWSALVLDAAYPIDQQTQQGRPLLPAQNASKTPVLAVVGGDDPGCALWQQAAPQWNADGVPTTVIPVPGRHHEFLYDQGIWTQVLAWLDAVRAR